jgi:hypothetical protein
VIEFSDDHTLAGGSDTKPEDTTVMTNAEYNSLKKGSYANIPLTGYNKSGVQGTFRELPTNEGILLALNVFYWILAHMVAQNHFPTAGVMLRTEAVDRLVEIKEQVAHLKFFVGSKLEEYVPNLHTGNDKKYVSATEFLEARNALMMDLCVALLDDPEYIDHFTQYYLDARVIGSNLDTNQKIAIFANSESLLAFMKKLERFHIAKMMIESHYDRQSMRKGLVATVRVILDELYSDKTVSAKILRVTEAISDETYREATLDTLAMDIWDDSLIDNTVSRETIFDAAFDQVEGWLLGNLSDALITYGCH